MFFPESYPLSNREQIGICWSIKENYIQMCIYVGQSYRVYKEMYFVLNLNGQLEYYSDVTQKHKCGSINILKECINIEKRNGTQKRDCKFILYTDNGRSYYFWCKNNKYLSFEWYYLIKKILCDKMTNLNHYLEIANENNYKYKNECDIDGY